MKKNELYSLRNKNSVWWNKSVHIAIPVEWDFSLEAWHCELSFAGAGDIVVFVDFANMVGYHEMITRGCLVYHKSGVIIVNEDSLSISC